MDFSQLKFDANGLIPAIAQDEHTNQVLMLAYMNQQSIEQTLETGYATYCSRSRQARELLLYFGDKRAAIACIGTKGLN